jgi:hypothetical protein
VADSTEECVVEQTSITSSFLEGIKVPSNLDFTVPAVSPRALTIMFSNARINIEPAVRGAARTFNQTAIQTKVITLNIPYSSDQPSLLMRLSLLGDIDPVQAEAGVNVRLVVCAADTTRVVNLSPDTGDVFIDSFEFTIQPRAVKPVCQITLFLLVEHDIDTDGAGTAWLNIQTLDMEIVTPDTGTFER